MKKRVPVIVLVIVLVIAFTIPVFASTQVAKVTLELTLSGSTATCRMRVTDLGKSINATMELWQGSTFITSWSASGTSVVSMLETYTITSGLTYTLKGYGTSGGVSFTAPEITKP